MDVLYQPSQKAHFQGLTVALGHADPARFTFEDFFKDYVVTGNEDCLTPNTVDRLSNPHSVSYIDLDGDCKPDLLLTRVDETNTPYFEVYL